MKNNGFTNKTVLINEIFPTSGISTYIKNILLVLFGSILLAISSKVQVPFWPVPMTMQTFIVFLIGMTYGWKLSFFTLFAYILEGGLGLPVFASGSGYLYLINSPTSGYILGMLFAATFIGFLSENINLEKFIFALGKRYVGETIMGYTKNYFLTFLILFIGSIIIFVIGIAYLGLIIGYKKAIIFGLLPFIPSELFKILLAVALIPTFIKYIK